jgi:hypothetical protein
MVRHPIRNTHPQLECLESRDLLAGNVTTTVVNGALTITGDAADNEIEVYQTAVFTYRIVGKHGTTVNQQASAYASGMTGNVNILMSDGSDALSLMLVARGDLYINMGRGDDFVSMGGFYELPTDALQLTTGVDVSGKLTVETLSGNDFVGVFDSRVVGTALITTGSDDDAAILFNTAFLSSLTVDAGSSDDAVELSNCHVTGTSKVSMGSGNDFLAVLASTFLEKPTFDGGSGDDTLFVNDNVFTRGAALKGFENLA